MKVKVSELTGAALDWAAIVAEHGADANNPRHIEHFKIIRGGHPLHQQAHYSTNWAHGGPIIERERITVHYDNPDNTWIAWHAADMNATRAESGETPLIAAMRCYVANKLGNEVDVPDSLV